MKGFMQWFKSSTKMKRWIFLILVGILLACYGLAKILVMKEISFLEVGEVVAVFVAGFLAIIIGLICLNKRTLEVLIESTDERMENKKNVNVKSLIFNKTVYDKGPNIVVIGGGTGLNTVLSGLKQYTNNLTAIVTVSDYGEEVSNSRRELQTMPLGDVKDSIISLASKDGQIDKLFNYEFRSGKLRGLNFSDIYFLAMKGINGNFEDSIIKSNEVINMIGKVIPVTLDEMGIVAELENGYIVKEKSRIAEVVSDKITKINRILLNPTNCRPAPGVIETIKNADCIIIGPGSLYTNVIPNLLVSGVTKAIKESAAIKVYISNIMTEPGQTDNYSVSDHLNAIIDHCGNGVVDYCIYDTGEIVPEFVRKYNREGQDLVEQDTAKAIYDVVSLDPSDQSEYQAVEAGIRAAYVQNGDELEFVDASKIGDVVRYKLARKHRISAADVQVHEITLKVKNENGDWETVSTENFPKKGIRITMPYPEGTSRNGFRFYGQHLFAKDMNGYAAGTTEDLKIMKRNRGISFVVHGLSPISIGWSEDEHWL